MQDIRALRALGIDLEDIKNAIAEATGTGEDKLEKLLDDVVARNQAYYTELIDLAQATAPERLVDERDIAAIRRQTWGAYKNITGSMGFLVVRNGRLTFLEPAKAYENALDSALLQVQSGAISYNQAIAEAVKQLADSGLKSVNYESGHVDSVDVAVRRAVMTGVNQLNQKYREQSMDYLETDLVETTAHLGARNTGTGFVNHESWQGQIFRWKVKPRTSKGDYPDFEEKCNPNHVQGIGGANCRHSYWPFLEGIMEPTYSTKELNAMKAENHKFEFEGKVYDGYTATQQQRSIERTIRKWKRRKAGAVTEEDKTAANIRLRRLNEKYRAFSKTAGLPEQRERMRVSYTDDASAKEASALLEKRANSGILSDVNYRGVPVTEEAIQRVPLFQPEGWSQEQAERLQEAHRELLRSVQDRPVGTEAGAVYTPDLRLIERKVGAAAAQQIVMPRCHEPHVLLHNHPSGEIFSHTDIVPFAMNQNMQAITVVGNSGNVYMLVKTDAYDGFRFLQAYNAVLKQLMGAINESNIGKYMAVMEEFLEGVEAYGAQFIKRG